jgi:hypothetical protein
VEEELKIIRIPHDAILENGEVDESQVEYVNSLSYFLSLE